jgi:hypothetical protein
MRSSVVAALILVGAALVVAGCGASGADKVDQVAARVGCLSHAEAVGQANLVRDEFAAGEVASRAYLRQHVFGNVPTSDYLDAAGHLKPLGSMSTAAENDFLAWIATLQKSSRWSERLDAAGKRARNLATCTT